MIKQTIAYTDFDGTYKTEDLFFHLTKMETVEFNAMYPGGIIEYANKLANENDQYGFIKFVKDLIVKAYGIKSGKKFVKDPEVTKAFSQSEACSELMYNLLNNFDELNDFVKGLRAISPSNSENVTNINPV